MNLTIPIATDSENHLRPEGVDLTDSFILDWRLDDQNFEILLELSLWPESRFYQTPPKDNYTCYRIGRLIFKDIRDIHGMEPLRTRDCTLDSDGKSDWGNIYGFRKNGYQIEFETDFTQVRLTCKEIFLTVEKERGIKTRY